ncbi:hypothetical protein [Myxococcus stipitatus]|nr:hypothetical protein [Myxococcus stipitatus]
MSRAFIQKRAEVMAPGAGLLTLPEGSVPREVLELVARNRE